MQMIWSQLIQSSELTANSSSSTGKRRRCSAPPSVLAASPAAGWRWCGERGGGPQRTAQRSRAREQRRHNEGQRRRWTGKRRPRSAVCSGGRGDGKEEGARPQQHSTTAHAAGGKQEADAGRRTKRKNCAPQLTRDSATVQSCNSGGAVITPRTR